MPFLAHLTSLLRCRPVMSPATLCLLLTAYFLVAMNQSLWHGIWPLFASGAGGSMAFLAALYLVIGSAIFLFFTLLLWPWLGRWLLGLVLLLSACVSYFMDNFGTYIDHVMVENALESNLSETLDLITPDFLLHVALYGLLPLLVLVWLRIRWPSWPRLLAGKLLWILLPLLVIGGIYQSFTKELIYFGRNHNELGGLVNPLNYVQAVGKVVHRQQATHDQVLEPLGTDAHLAPATDQKKRLVILVIGETARANNQGLQGYARNTTPELQAHQVTYFRNATSCGTATRISVPCMFSRFGRANYDSRKIESTENVLDILKRAGVDVLWRENDNGCKGVCQRLPYESFSNSTDPDFCAEGDCIDAILTRDLDKQLRLLKSPALLVLHLKGSHGPAYYRRYPPAFRHFTPTCDTPEIQTCDHERIVNTYDNTILYTDHILGSLIDTLKQEPADTETALVYLSDHGESLGEGGEYLHGLPWAIAPPEQKHIPFLMWLSPAWSAARPHTKACIDSHVDTPVSQDNLFDTLLGLFQVETSIYRKSLDLTNNC